VPDFDYNPRSFGEEQLQNPTGKDQILAALNHDVKSSEWILAALHRQWYEQIFWTLGEHYMEWNQRTRRFQVRPARTYIPRSITNHILPKVEVGVSLFLDSLPRPKAVSKTKEDKDRSAAETANGVLRYKDEEIRFGRKKRETGMWTVTTGTCYNEVLLDEADKEKVRLPKYDMQTVPVLDPMTGRPLLGPNGEPVQEETEQKIIDPETGEQAYDEVVMADENVEVRSPFEIIPDWAARYPWEFRRYTHFRAQTRDWIGRVFGSAAKKAVKADKGMGILGYYQLKVLDIITRSSATGRLGLPTAYGGSAADWRFMEDAAVVIRRMQLPTDERPEGRMMIIASGEVLYDGKYPYGDRLNLYTFRWSVLPGSIFGFGMVRNLIMPQKRLNGLDTQDDLIRKTTGNPQWLVAKGSQTSIALGTSEPGHIITYKHRPNLPKPERLDAKAPAAYNQYQRESILKDMEEVSGIKHVLGGSNPTGVTAGVSLELLTEQAAKRFSPAIEDNREEFKALYMHRLEVAQEAPAWSVERAVPIQGEDGERDVQHFRGADFRGNLTIEIEAVPVTAFSHTLRKESAKWAAQAGLIDLTSAQNREKMRSLLGVQEFEEPFTLDQRRAQMENELIEAGETIQYDIDGKVQPTGPYDDDETHITVHKRLAKSRRWNKLPPSIKSELQRHLDAHILRMVPSQPEAETIPGQEGTNQPAPGTKGQKPGTKQAPVETPEAVGAGVET
jgi:hypothetical protein